ncbi:MAG: hypothetical protein HQ546_04405 [Planctomycetes bacterium]|nr:hypothetical protein [Planctomycetota bacterium]
MQSYTLMSKKNAKLLAVLVSAIAAALPGCANTSGQAVAPAPLSHPSQREAWPNGGAQGEKLSTEHYCIFTSTANQSLRNGICGFMEAARANYVQLTGLTGRPAGGKRLAVYLFGDRQQWASLTETITGRDAETYLRVQSGGYCYDGVCVFWDIGTMATYSVAAHEGLHQFLHDAAGDNLPVWVEEGLAVQAEGYRIRRGLVLFEPSDNTSRLTTLRKTILAGRWRSVDRLVEMNAADNIQESAMHGAEYYSQLWALLLMIRSDEQYRAGLEQLLRATADGQLAAGLGIEPQEWAQLQRNGKAYSAVVGPRAFAHYIDADTKRFEQRYRAFAEKLAKVYRTRS